jgi:glycosyltransferase involved in cell wall biosynthesis
VTGPKDVGAVGAPARPTTVLHVVRSTQRRGAEVFGNDLSAALSDLGFASRVVALTPLPGEPALPLDVLGERPLGAATLRALRRAGRGADVVVAHGSRTLDACALALAGIGTPFVYRSIGDPAAWSTRGLRRVRTAILLRRAAHVVVLWPGAARTVGRAHGVPTAKTTVVPNGVTVADHPVPEPAARVAARARLGLPAEGPVAACIGALGAEKRVGDVLDAVAAVPGVHLLVVGDGPERPALEGRATAPGLTGRVHFAGVLPGSDEALAAADVVVLASRTEGMPGVLIEAGLAARPAVATAVGAVAEVVEGGVTGVLVAPGDTGALAEGLRTVLLSGPATAAMGAAARRRCAARFSMSVVAQRWGDVLSTVVSAARRR